MSAAAIAQLPTVTVLVASMSRIQLVSAVAGSVDLAVAEPMEREIHMKVRVVVVFGLVAALASISASCAPPPSSPAVPDPPQWLLDVKPAAADGSRRVVMSGKGCNPNTAQGVVVVVDVNGEEGVYFPRAISTDASGGWVVDEFTAFPGNTYAFQPLCLPAPGPSTFVSKTLDT